MAILKRILIWGRNILIFLFVSSILAVVDPNPRRFNSGKPSPYMLKRQRQITSLMGKLLKIQMGYDAGEIENKNRKIKKRKKWRASFLTTSDILIMQMR